MALIVERVEVSPSYNEQGVRNPGGTWLQDSLAVVVGPLPQIWAAAESQTLLRKSVLNVMTFVVTAVGCGAGMSNPDLGIVAT